MKSTKNIHPQVEVTNLTSHLPGYYFFGYYDVPQWSRDGRHVLAHRTEFMDRMPDGNDEAEIGVIDRENNNEFRAIDKTKAWNFQQGARLQWLPNSSQFIYNVRRSNEYCATVKNIDGRTVNELPAPIYAVHPGGKYGFSLNFARLERLGGYGYAGLLDTYKDDPAPTADGIARVNFDTGKTELVLSIRDVARFCNPVYKKNNSHHYLAFPTFNPSGSRFCFLHRFWLADGGFYTRLLTVNPDGSDLHLVAEGTFSHFDWFDDEHILIWGRSRSFLTKARRHAFFASALFRPILNILRRQVHGIIRHRIIGDQYLLFTDKTGKRESIGVGILTDDGHPTRFKETSWVVTDTYPDEEHYRTLMLYNLDQNKRIDLGEFYALPGEAHIVDYKQDESWDISGMRSDLHPRWNRDGTQVCIDSVHDGKKDIFVVDATKIVSNNEPV